MSRIRTGAAEDDGFAAISVLRPAGRHNIAKAPHYMARDAARALKLLTTSPNTTLP